MESYKIVEVNAARQEITVEFPGYGRYDIRITPGLTPESLHKLCLMHFPLDHAKRMQALQECPVDMTSFLPLIDQPVEFSLEDAELSRRVPERDPITEFADEGVELPDVDLTLNMLKL